MTDNNNADSSGKPLPNDVQQELNHGQQLLDIMRKRRRLLERRAAELGPRTDPAIIVELEDIQSEISRLETQLSSLESKAKELESATSKGQIATGSHIAQAAEGATASVVITQSGKGGELTEEAKIFVPSWSVLRSKVQYVDATLALKYADESQNVNIMLSFTTLFLGSCIGFAVSLTAADQPTDIVLLGTSTAFTALLTIIFAILTIRAWKKAEEAKRQIFKTDENR